MHEHRFMLISSLADFGLSSPERYKAFFAATTVLQSLALRKDYKKVLVPSYNEVGSCDSFEELPLLGSVVVYYLCERNQVVHNVTQVRLLGSSPVIDPSDLIEFNPDK